MKTLIKITVSFIAIIFVSYFVGGKFEYKNGLTYQTVLDNKIYSFLMNNLNNGKPFESEYIEPKNYSKFNALSIEIDSAIWSKILDNYTYYLDNVEKFSVLENNKWQKVKITVKGKTYNAKIKCHGKTPSGHLYNDMMSLSIKFKKEKPPLFSKRMNLIIYKRLRESSDVINYLSDNLNLYHLQSTLYSVDINKGKKHLMYLEERTNSEFFKKRDINNILICKKDHLKTLLINCLEQSKLKKNEEFNTLKTIQLFEKKISTSELSSKNKDFIKKINRFISNHKSDSLSKYLDIDYFSRYEALRKIGGFTNHGFEKQNLLLYPDTSRDNLIMISHRDHLVRQIGNQYSFEKELLQKFYWQKHLFLECLVLHDSIRLKSYKYLFDINSNKNSIFKDLDSIENIHSQFVNKSLIKNWFYHAELSQQPTGVNITTIFENNLNKIIYDLTPDSPIINKKWLNDSTLNLIISPNSLSELKIGGISIKEKRVFDLRLKRSYSSNNEKIEETLISVKKNKNLSKIISELSFFNKIDKKSNTIKCTYYLELKFNSSQNKSVVNLDELFMANFSNNMKRVEFMVK
jgi:hypothetical protein